MLSSMKALFQMFERRKYVVLSILYSVYCALFVGFITPMTVVPIIPESILIGFLPYLPYCLQ